MNPHPTPLTTTDIERDLHTLATLRKHLHLAPVDTKRPRLVVIEGEKS